MKMYFLKRQRVSLSKKKHFHDTDMPTKKNYMWYVRVSFFETLDFSVILLILAIPEQPKEAEK